MSDASDPGAAPPTVTVGMACTDLVAYPERWINRRVETVEILSHEETRRRVSVDFTLPDDKVESLKLPDGIVVPISVLSKEARRNFDLRDEGGRALPVLGKAQNGELAHFALLHAVLTALPAVPSQGDLEVIAAELRRVVFGDADDAVIALGELAGRAESGDAAWQAIFDDDTCSRLLAALWANYVLFAVIAPGDPHRRVLKYSYGDDFDFRVPGSLRDRLTWSEIAYRLGYPDRRRFVIDCPGAWRAASFHAEVVIPEELRVESAVLFDLETTQTLSDFDRNKNRAALYASDEMTDELGVAAFVEIAPERSGRTSQAAVSAVLVAALLWLGVGSGLDAKNPGAAVSLLLAGAALFSGIAASQGEHRLVKTIFASSRRALAVVTLAALAGSATLAMEEPSAHPVGVWRIAAIGATLAALRVVWSAVRAPA